MKYFTKKLVNFFVATAVMLGTLGIGSSATATAATIKVMTYNIHSGIGTDGVLNLDRIASVIQAENPDIVALNEVDKNTTRSGMVDQAQYLANKLGMYYVFGKSTNMFGGEYGNAVLSKTPISSYTVHNLTSVGEQRTCLEVQTQVNGTTINFFATHLGLDSNERVTQVNEIKDLISSTIRTGFKIVAGDFNLKPTDPGYTTMLFDFVDAFAAAGIGTGYTYGNPNVSMILDYIFVGKDPSAYISSCTVPSTTLAQTASDHRPVVAVVNLGSTTPPDNTTIKVMTYNIQFGKGTDGVIDLDRIASVIQAENPDIVGLNAVDKNTTRSGMVDQAQYLANKLGMYYVFGRSIYYDGGEYGNAVLSKTPISSYKVHNLTSSGEQRTCLEVQTQVNGTTINFFVTHLTLDSAIRLTQVKEIKKVVTNKIGPKIVVGTFQESPTGTAVKEMLYDFRDAFAVAGTGTGYTYANPNVSTRNSYIFGGIYPAYNITITNCSVPSTTLAQTASIHRPVVAVVNLGSTTPSGNTTIKTMTYNIHVGIGTDGVLNLDRIASVIQAENPDIVGLNAVDKNTTRSGMIDQAQYLANKLGMYYVFGKSTNMYGGEYGNAVLSKTPISSYTVHNLTSVGEQRTCLEVQTQVNGTTINFFVTHLGLDSNERITQVDEIKQLVANRTGPKIVVGTFQDSPTGTPVQSMLYDFRDAFAVAGTSSGFTNANPNVTVRNSYIFIGKNYATNITNCTVPSTTSARTGSTHRPVVSIVNW